MALNEKDMSKLQDLPRFSQVIKNKKATLRNYKGGTVLMAWGWNDASALDQIFVIKTPGGEELHLDWQEVMHYGRAVSDYKYAYEKLKAEAELRAGR